ncbi:hypothetical protein RG47T_0791 [Mucilaginibacter polytrichastri]|uniref:Uncharacterized protein n=1 Tax=Mucilaginibacter polytrichastri TaxID=1302689 RepID=A0A1Q5ZUB2_9SPHI|nr:hypothetical protein [Mucilaginibacter polytrichastri]OKS85346.1 hypothetical protein RG47T_0791 [Mucilaginibacter polytrichastri]SFS40383.1 hypothetical protein SAMN04487890_101302 [Mucilaginibacter polytrichastri]
MSVETREQKPETLQLFSFLKRRKFKITIDHIYLIIAILAFIAAGFLAFSHYNVIEP